MDGRAPVIFEETALPGAFVVELERRVDERGFFARTWCADEFAAAGLSTGIAQCNVSYTARRGTLRGMHYQAAPQAEMKLVRCTRGAIYDVIVDLRPDSPAHCSWVAVELTAENRRALYVPEGVAHGFQTLADDCDVEYQMSTRFAPGAGRGVRFDDPAFGIQWPGGERYIAERDAQWPDYRPG